ncbi:MAG TPA: glycoside hydrolase family 3 N-terminal domain-containing protein [Gemmatimonadaceae bacterium]|nr:glycoside hydrolase family 3 N-terminal domain-containing protein [Gemmatimonadaceae bacterium]
MSAIRHRAPAPRTILTAALSAAALLAAPGAARAQAPGAAADRVAAARMERFVDSVLAGLTLEEKLGQLNQYSGRNAVTGPQTAEAGAADVRAGRVGSFLNVVGAQATRDLQRLAVEGSRARIPVLFAYDVIHGFRTIFPMPLAEAASWDTAAVRRAARVGASEAAAHGLHWTFAPMVDIARDPRWGRVVEGAGEDPFLGSAMAAARVHGFQGPDLRDSLALLATAKHFVAYGGAEGGRDYNIADVPPRALWEVYLPPFKAAVDAGARSIMASFNEVDGTPMHVHRALIDGVLRDQWKWNGVLVSDYTAVLELLKHGVAEDSAHAARRSIDAGVDVDMVSNFFFRFLPGEIRAGRLPVAVVDSAVRRVLRVKYELGLFDDPYRHSSVARERALTLAPAFIAEARDMARRSIVLLKNDRQTLPLRKDIGTLAVIGPLADDARSALGSWAAMGKPEDAVTPLAGIRAAVGRGTRVLHARGAPVDSADTSGIAEAVRVARQADAVVLVLGEHHDMSAESRNRTSLDLPGVQLALAQAVVATGKPVAVVLMNGRPLSIPWLAQHAPAIVESWFLGVQTGPALADVLFGDYNPGGKLPVSFPYTVGQVPIYYNHKNTGRPATADRWTSKYIDAPFTPLYPFGHGLSYTTFAYGEPTLGAREIRATDSLVVTVEVTNTGARAGDEVVQLYLRDDVASVTRPVRELKGFERVTLRAGERRTVRFVLRPDALAFHDADLRRVIEPGTFTLWVGGSSVGGKEARFRVVGERRVVE